MKLVRRTLIGATWRLVAVISILFAIESAPRWLIYAREHGDRPVAAQILNRDVAMPFDMSGEARELQLSSPHKLEVPTPNPVDFRSIKDGTWVRIEMRIAYGNRSPVFFREHGELTSIATDSMVVHPGSMLAKVDCADQMRALDIAQRQVERDLQNYEYIEGQKINQRDKALALALVDAELGNMRVRQESSRVRNCTLHSKRPGVVVFRTDFQFERGSYVVPGTYLFDLARLNDVRVEGEIARPDLDRVERPIVIEYVPFLGRSLPVRIKDASEANGTIRITGAMNLEGVQGGYAVTSGTFFIKTRSELQDESCIEDTKSHACL